MNLRLSHLSIFLLLAFGASLASAERIQFQRQKFDRSRFKRPDPSAPLAPPAPVEPVTAVEPATTAEEAPRAEPTGTVGKSGWIEHGNAQTSNPSNGGTIGTQSGWVEYNDGGPGRPNYPQGFTAEEKKTYDAPLFDEVPNKWFKKAKQFEELQELQKKTGACMILYFKNPTIPNQKGLCNWYEKTVTKNMKWRKAMRHYVKLEITLPGSKITRALGEQFHTSSTPNVMILHPGASQGTRLNLFEYKAGSRPMPVEAEQVLLQLKEASTAAYGAILE